MNRWDSDLQSSTLEIKILNDHITITWNFHDRNMLKEVKAKHHIDKLRMFKLCTAKRFLLQDSKRNKKGWGKLPDVSSTDPASGAVPRACAVALLHEFDFKGPS